MRDRGRLVCLAPTHHRQNPEESPKAHHRTICDLENRFTFVPRRMSDCPWFEAALLVLTGMTR